ncbi:MAG TPA: sphingomyelin phosphodiesterase [Pyrinomonadaceae bacterium]|jgi:endonuclease/exonuclease/phosphatase family metal-dependent hydrolase
MPSEVTLKILAYNVQMLDQLFRYEYHNKERAKLIANILVRSDYDVLIFSEAFDNGAREEMNKILMRTFTQRTAVVGNDDDININQVLAASFVAGGLIGAAVAGIVVWTTGRPRSDGGVFIVSRWPILLQGQIVYRNSASEDRLGRKGVSWALIDKQGFHFNVFGTHTQADDKHYVTRVRQLEQFQLMYRTVAPNWQPALLGGDLNVDYCFDQDNCQNRPPDVPDDPEDRGDGRDGPGGDGPRRALAGASRNPPEAAPAVGQSSAAARDCCSSRERGEMLNRLRASPPQDLTKYTYTRDYRNDLKKRGGGDPGLNHTLDYVLHSTELDTVLHAANRRPSPLRPQPIRSSLEIVRPRGVFSSVSLSGGPKLDTRERDLSDHYGVLGTYTFRLTREDSHLFTGTWKCVEFNGGPDTHNHRLTFTPFGMQVLDDFDGRQTKARVHQFYTGKEFNGKIVIKNASGEEHVLYDYTFSKRPEFDRHFIPGVIQLPGGRRETQTRPRPKNALLLRSAQRSALYAFEQWPPVDVRDDFRSGGPV